MDVALFDWDDFAAPTPSAPPSRTAQSGGVATLVKTTWASRLAVFDLETTGIDVTTSRIVTAHVGILDESGDCVERLDWLADPGVDIPEGATAIHGVTTERARRHGKPARDVVSEVVEALSKVFARGLPVVVYNAPYDFSLLLHEARRHGIDGIAAPLPVVDPLVIDRFVDRFRPGKRTLTATARHYGVDLLDAHEAASDAIAAGRVAQAIAARHPELAERDVHDLHSDQVAWYLDHAIDFESYMRRTHNPAFFARKVWPIA